MAASGDQPSTLVEGWRVALLLLAFALVTFVLERSFHIFEHMFHTKMGLKIALEHIKNEILLVGSISLLLSVFQEAIAKICIPHSKSSVYKHVQSPPPALPLATAGRHLLAGNYPDYCEPKAQALWPINLQHDTHIFIFVVACTHVAFSVITVHLTLWRVHSWRKLEEASREGHSHDEVELRKFHGWLYSNVGSSKFTQFFLMLFRQYFTFVNKSLYNNVRKAYIAKNGFPAHYDFHEVVVKGLENELMETLHPAWHLWVISVVWYAIPPPSYISFWMYGLTVLIILLVGGKLLDIFVKISVQAAVKDVVSMAVRPSEGNGAPTPAFSVSADGSAGRVNALPAPVTAATAPKQKDDTSSKRGGGKSGCCGGKSGGGGGCCGGGCFCGGIDPEAALRGQQQFVMDMLNERKEHDFHTKDAVEFFWFRRPRFMTWLFTVAYFQNTLSISICVFALLGVQGTFTTWGGIPKWAIGLQLALDLLLMPQVGLAVLPLYSLILPLGSHCPDKLRKHARAQSSRLSGKEHEILERPSLAQGPQEAHEERDREKETTANREQERKGGHWPSRSASEAPNPLRSVGPAPAELPTEPPPTAAGWAAASATKAAAVAMTAAAKAWGGVSAAMAATTAQYGSGSHNAPHADARPAGVPPGASAGTVSLATRRPPAGASSGVVVLAPRGATAGGER